MRFKTRLMLSGVGSALLMTMPVAAQEAPPSERPPETQVGQAEEPDDEPQAFDEDREDFEGATPRVEYGPGAPEPGSDETVIEAIVITGARWEELFDQPVPVTLFSAEERNLVSAGTARQLVDLTPGFNFTEQFGLNVRGIGRQTAQTLLGQENTVTQYVNGFLNIVPFNIAESTLFGGNVQFLRGPQGTRYGRNAIAGAVNLLARSPTDEFRGEFVAGIGRGDWYNIGANIAGPLSDDFAIRIGAQKFISDGTTDNLGQSDREAGPATDNLYVELQLEGNVGDFHFLTRSTHFDYDNRPSYTVGCGVACAPSRYNTDVVFGALAPNPQLRFDGPVPEGPYEVNVDYAGFDRLNNNMQHIVNADYDFGFAKLYYVGGYQQYVAVGSGDLDQTSRRNVVALPTEPFAPGTVIPTFYTYNYYNDVYYYSQELRLEGETPDNSLEWIVGGYYLNMDFDENYWEAIPFAQDVITTPVQGGGPALAERNPRKATYEQRNIYDIRSTALFGNIVHHLSDTLSIDAGLRYTWDEKESLTDFRYVFFYPPFFAGDFTPEESGANTFRRDEGVTGRAALVYRPNPLDEFYVSYARGYKASAFTLGQGLPPNNVAEPEHIDVFELGATYILPNSVKLYGALFYMIYDDMQIPISTRAVLNGEPVGPVFQRFENADDSRIYGVELEASWAPVDDSLISATYTYINAEFDEFCPPIEGSSACGALDITEPPAMQVPEDLSGNEVPRTPRHKASLYGYYTFDLSDFGSIIPGASVSWQDGFYVSSFNKDRFFLEGHTVANFTLTYRAPDKSFDVVGSLTNAFGEVYGTNVILNNIGGEIFRTRAPGPDTFYSLTVRYRI